MLTKRKRHDQEAASNPFELLYVELRRPAQHEALLSSEPHENILALEPALYRLGKIDPRREWAVERRYSGGLTTEEAAEALEVSIVAVKRDWAVAKAWLHAELADQAAAP